MLYTVYTKDFFCIGTIEAPTANAALAAAKQRWKFLSALIVAPAHEDADTLERHYYIQ